MRVKGPGTVLSFVDIDVTFVLRTFKIRVAEIVGWAFVKGLVWAPGVHGVWSSGDGRKACSRDIQSLVLLWTCQSSMRAR